MKFRRSGFTLIELLVVIAIIGILSVLAIVALGSARQKARDSKRVSDINQISKALELYYTDNNSYPSQVTPGQSITFGSTTYLASVPSNPAPRNDGTCPNVNYQYAQSGSNDTGYTLHFCLAGATGGAQSGMNYASAGGLNGDGSLVGWWKLSEGTGTTAADSSSTGTTGTLTNSPTWTADSPSGSGYSLTLNGTNNYVNIPTTSALKPASVTVSAWVKWNGTDTDGGIVGMQNNGSGSDGYGLSISGGNVVFWIYAVGNPDVIGNGGALTANTWSHVVGTFDGAVGKKLYVNGVLVQTRNHQYGSLVYQNNPLRIGYNSAVGYLSSAVGETRIYNRVLSLSEIQALYAAGR